MKNVVHLQKIGELDKSVLVNLKTNLEVTFKEFNLSVRILLETFPLVRSDYNTKKFQYKASKILNRLKKYTEQKHLFRILGVLEEDIYSKNLNFNFGLAKKPKKKYLKYPTGALISILRLQEKFYRRPENRKLFNFRVLKEALHELGHTFGLEHCNNFCVMRFSKHLSATDGKPSKFCALCYSELEKFFSSSS